MASGYELRGVLLPVADLETALDFYTGALGWSLRFRDGARYAALDAGGFGLALVATEDQPVEGVTTLNVRVADLEQAVSDLVAGGAEVIVAPVNGPHEMRAAVRDVSGNVLTLSTPHPPSASLGH